jgi:outer membrane protein OmpA-like peptidoglycan-associated protein
MARKAPGIALLLLLVTAAGFAQTNNTAPLDEAKASLGVAESAGAPLYAKALYDDAAYRIRFAQDNWNGKRSAEALMRAIEANAAAQAATAKARWLSTNAAIRTLQSDITRFGGTANVNLADEPSGQEINRGATTKEHIDTAQAAIDQARAAGAEQLVADANLKLASDMLDSARKVSRAAASSEVADSLAYRAEMLGRRAYYLARFNDASRRMPDLQLQRTRLAQAASEQSAAAERAQREEADRRTAELRQQLAAQESNRQAQAAELEQLRQQIDQQRAAAQAQRVADRAARAEAERRVDEAARNYQLAIASPTMTAADIEAARRALEDANIALRAAQERERLAQDAMNAEVVRMRTDLDAAQRTSALSPQVLSTRQADLIARQQELEQFRMDVGAAAARRADAERAQQAAITAALSARQEREAQAQALRQAAEMAQQQAAQAQQQATQAQQQAAQAQQAQAEAEKARLAAQQQAAEQAKTAEAQTKAAEEAKAAAQQATAAAQAAQAELEKTRKELAERDAEARMLRMQNELARIAATRREARGLIVTLSSGVFFDSGKTALKKGAQSTLTRIANQLKSDNSIRITVEGHTDNVGTPAKNQTLSEKRAEAVRDFLVGAGVASDRVTAAGKGDTQPIATNKTAAGRQQNRRVELVIAE